MEFQVDWSLENLWFVQAHSDSSLFFKHIGSSFIMILVYVDDVFLANDNLDQIKLVKNFLHDTFKIKDLGEMKYFLGIEILRSSADINVCQRKYTLTLLHDIGFLGCKPTFTPMVPSTKLTK